MALDNLRISQGDKMKKVYKSVLFAGLTFALIAGYVHSSQMRNNSSDGDQKISAEQANFDAMMNNWLKRNQNKIKASISQDQFDSLIGDWLKRRDEAQRRQESHRHGAGGHSHDH